MNKAEVRALLLNNDRAVERALVVLFERQTEEEQSSGTTNASNRKGFSAFHAKQGTYLAKWILSGKRLSGRFMEQGRKMACYYAGQLAEAANDRAAAKAAADLGDFSPVPRNDFGEVMHSELGCAEEMAIMIEILDPFNNHALFNRNLAEGLRA
jgi:hypothetical protein